MHQKSLLELPEVLLDIVLWEYCHPGKVYSSNPLHSKMMGKLKGKKNISTVHLCSVCADVAVPGELRLQENAVHMLTELVPVEKHITEADERLAGFEATYKPDQITGRVNELWNKFKKKKLNKRAGVARFNSGARDKLLQKIRKLKDIRDFWVQLQAACAHIRRNGVVDVCTCCGKALAPLRHSAQRGQAKSVTVDDDIVIKAVANFLYYEVKKGDEGTRFTWNGTKTNAKNTGNNGNTPTN